jgi:hypothetical protein
MSDVTGLDWHIITGSKGGAGKTLLSLMLLAYFSTEYDNESVLILDLNSMNTDTTALLKYEKESLPSTIIPMDSSRVIMFRKISFEKNDKTVEFVLGYPVNPFKTFSNDDFLNLIALIGKEAKNIEDNLGIKDHPISRVLVDTNHHFCNLFPDNDNDYEKYKAGNLENNQYTVWFLWVYRQLAKLLRHDSSIDKDSEEKIFNSTIGSIERAFKPKNKFDTLGPIVHVYAPVSMLSSNEERSFFAMITNTKKENIDGLKSLEDIKDRGDYVGYKELKETLSAKNTAQDKKDKQQHNREIFDQILSAAVKKMGKEKLPINIFPISRIESPLHGYTDQERTNPLAALMELDIYKKFKRVLDAKYGKARGK